MTYSVCSQKNKVFKIHLSVPQGCSNVAFLWSDEWRYHSGCLFITVSEKVARTHEFSCHELKAPS